MMLIKETWTGLFMVLLTLQDTLGMKAWWYLKYVNEIRVKSGRNLRSRKTIPGTFWGYSMLDKIESGKDLGML